MEYLVPLLVRVRKLRLSDFIKRLHCVDPHQILSAMTVVIASRCHVCNLLLLPFHTCSAVGPLNRDARRVNLMALLIQWRSFR